MRAKLQFEKSEDIIDICLDPVFKAVFTRDTPHSVVVVRCSVVDLLPNTADEKRSLFPIL